MWLVSMVSSSSGNWTDMGVKSMRAKLACSCGQGDACKNMSSTWKFGVGVYSGRGDVNSIAYVSEEVLTASILRISLPSVQGDGMVTAISRFRSPQAFNPRPCQRTDTNTQSKANQNNTNKTVPKALLRFGLNISFSSTIIQIR